ncbi:MAG TPA: hypothetical protein DCZ92_04220 [Elusimicrobia bacterium]|nr:MAG: hypothetical protein A2016_07860 [Elusimicrobia bacterium GWF2_62_30]HBA60021.1 hypothetical protein [Elusimicrobiota bacterium]
MENEDLVFKPGEISDESPVQRSGLPVDLGLGLEEGPFIAGFNERFLAYFIDCLPFLLLSAVTFKLAVKGGLVASNFAGEMTVKLLWIAVYILYQGVLSSGGRATLGKRIMGLRVVDADGQPLSLGRGFARAFSYFLSSGTMNLGFILALFTQENRALHDYLAGSRVVSLKERGDLANGVILTMSWALLAFFVGSWINNTVLKVSVPEKKQIYAAYRTISKLATLENIYMRSTGHYTNNLKSLASLTRNVEAVKSELDRNLDGGKVMLVSDGRKFRIVAKARNWRKTEVEVKSTVTLPPEAALQ